MGEFAVASGKAVPNKAGGRYSLKALNIEGGGGAKKASGGQHCRCRRPYGNSEVGLWHNAVAGKIEGKGACVTEVEMS